jgi:DNA-binding YbaB/EbfC family protein
MFKNLTNLASMVKQAQAMGEKMKHVGDDLKGQRVTGASGGGLVEVEMNGASEMLRIRIDPSLIEDGDCEMLEELIPAAVNQAQEKARALHAQAMQEMTSGLDIPGVEEALSKITGGGS